MKKFEDEKNGLMAIDPDDSNENTLRFGRMKYDGKRRLFVSDSCLNLEDFFSFYTKKEAVKVAQNLGFTANHVERIGSRFWSGWGIRYDHRNNYFLANFG